MIDTGNDKTLHLEADLLFTAYCVTTTISMTGNFITHTVPPVNLINEYIVSIPFDVSAPGQTKSASMQIIPESIIAAQESSEVMQTQFVDMERPQLLEDKIRAQLQDEYQDMLSMFDAGYSEVLDDGYFCFYDIHTLAASYDVRGYNLAASQTCSRVGTPRALEFKISGGIPIGSSDLTNPPKCSGCVQRAEYTRIIIFSVVIPNIALMILLYLIVIRIYREKRRQAVSIKSPKTTSDVQPYVDQKAELEDGERRKHELDVDMRVYEMEGEDRIFEMPSEADMRIWATRLDRLQELRGAEHSKELEVPSSI